MFELREWCKKIPESTAIALSLAATARKNNRALDCYFSADGKTQFFS